MNISELIVSLDNQYDVTTISSIEGYILFYQMILLILRYLTESICLSF